MHALMHAFMHLSILASINYCMQQCMAACKFACMYTHVSRSALDMLYIYIYMFDPVLDMLLTSLRHVLDISDKRYRQCLDMLQTCFAHPAIVFQTCFKRHVLNMCCTLSGNVWPWMGQALNSIWKSQHIFFFISELIDEYKIMSTPP